MTEPNPWWIFAHPVGKLILFMVANGVLITGLLMIIKGTLPPPFTRVRTSAGLGTFVLLIGLTMLMQFGTPDLFTALRNLLKG